MHRSLFALLVVVLAGCGAAPRADGGVGLLPVGAEVPNLAGRDQTEATHHLADERGHATVVFFYPKDESPGCTKEACAFRDAWARFTAAHVQVYGVSDDASVSHLHFANTQQLPFPLIADTSGAWGSAFGVGKRLFMYQRVSFLIDAKGRVAKVYPDVDPAQHADEVLRDAAALR